MGRCGAFGQVRRVLPYLGVRRGGIGKYLGKLEYGEVRVRGADSDGRAWMEVRVREAGYMEQVRMGASRVRVGELARGADLYPHPASPTLFDRAERLCLLSVLCHQTCTKSSRTFRFLTLRLQYRKQAKHYACSTHSSEHRRYPVPGSLTHK